MSHSGMDAILKRFFMMPRSWVEVEYYDVIPIQCWEVLRHRKQNKIDWQWYTRDDRI
jgi:hypothetical protein